MPKYVDRRHPDPNAPYIPKYVNTRFIVKYRIPGGGIQYAECDTEKHAGDVQRQVAAVYGAAFYLDTIKVEPHA